MNATNWNGLVGTVAELFARALFVFAIIFSAIATNTTRAQNILQNPSFEALPVLSDGQSDVAPGGAKWITTSPQGNGYVNAVTGIADWTIRFDQPANNHVDAGPSRSRASSGTRSLFSNRWSRRFFQEIGVVTGGATYTASIDAGAFGPQKAGYLQLIAGGIDVNGQLTPGSQVIAQRSFGTSDWTNFVPDIIIPFDQWQSVSLNTMITLDDPSIGQPMLFSFHIANGCVGSMNFDSASLSVESPNPDLRTEALVSVDESRINDSVSITWTSRNRGAGIATGTWTDRLYLSLDDAFDNNDLELGSGFVRSGPLEVDGAYQTIAQVTLPSTLLPDEYYLIVRNDTGGQVTEGAGESNNTFVSSTRIRVLPPLAPDLRVSNITPPNNAIPGSIVEIAYTVTNVGAGVATGSWDETLYGSLDATIGNDLLGPTTRFSTTLQPGQAVQRRYNVQVPNVPVGNYWLVACVDTNNGGEISESDEGNNCGIVPVCFNCNSPNLTVIEVTALSQATAGVSTSVSWTVRNEGLAEAAGTWIDRVELAPTCSDGTRTVLAEFRRSSVLAPGSEYTLARSVVVPPETEGPRRFIVTTDRLNELSEPGGEYDNEGCSPTDTQVNLPARPDLIVSNVTPNQPEGVFNQTFALSWTVRNIGAVATSATWNDRVFISPDAIRNANDFPLEPIRAFVEGPLDPNAESTVQHTVQLPLRASLPAGSYYFIVVTDIGNVVDEQRESNQFAVSGPVQISRPPLPDLQVIASSISANACPGQTVEMVYTVTNAGNEPATGSWIERAFSSPDNQVGNDYFGSQRTVSGPLAPGEQVTRTLNVVVPQEGLSYYGVLCIDPQGTVFESDEANNCALTQSSAVVGRPDLVPEGIQASPQTVLADGNLDISWAVRNNGVCASGSSFLDSVSLVSVDGQQTYLLGSGVHPSLIAPSQLDPLSRTFAVPGRIAGDFRVQVRADSAANVLEPDEVNNVALSAGVVSVSQPPRADIFVVPGTIELPADGLVSSVGVVHYTLVNLGAADAVGPWTDRIVARRSGSEPGPDIDLGSLPFTGSVGNGEMLTRTANITLPTLPGDYIVCVIVDSGDLLNEGLEGGEDNNRECSIDSFNADGYRVVTVPSLSEALSGTPVSISGYAESLSTNQRLADVPVWINYNVRSFNRPIRVRTNVNGDFGITSQVPIPLLPTEAGRYRITAGPPNAIATTPESSFVLHGLRATPEFTGLRVAPGFKGETRQLEVFNAGDVTLTGLNASIVGAPSGLLVDLQLNGEPVEGQSITGQQIVRPVVQLIAPPATQFYDGPIIITWSTDQGAAATTILRVRVAPRDPAITAIPPTIDTGIVTSTIDEPQQTTVQFTLTNTGGLPTGPINVLLPAEVLCDGVPEPTAPWMTLSTPATLPSLNPDETSIVVIVLAPTIQQPLCAFVGQLEVRFDSGTRSTMIPFQLKHRSNAVGNVTVAAANEETYWAPNHPPLENALVTIRDARTNQVFGTQITGEDGLAHFEDLPEGTYYAEAARDQHLPYRNIVNVRREETAQVDAFLPFQAVTYSWTVDPIQIEDRYRFVLEANFVTNVYVPTLDITVIDPDTGAVSRVLDLDDVEGEKQFFLRIENRGLVASEVVNIRVQNTTTWELVPLVDHFSPLNPGPSNALTVPLAVRRSLGRQASDPCSLPSLSTESTITCGGQPRVSATPTYGRATVECPGSPLGCCSSGGGNGSPPGAPGNPYSSPPTPPPAPSCCLPSVKIIKETGRNAGDISDKTVRDSIGALIDLRGEVVGGNCPIESVAWAINGMRIANYEVIEGVPNAGRVTQWDSANLTVLNPAAFAWPRPSQYFVTVRVVFQNGNVASQSCVFDIVAPIAEAIGSGIGTVGLFNRGGCNLQQELSLGTASNWNPQENAGFWFGVLRMTIPATATDTAIAGRKKWLQLFTGFHKRSTGASGICQTRPRQLDGGAFYPEDSIDFPQFDYNFFMSDSPGFCHDGLPTPSDTPWLLYRQMTFETWLMWQPQDGVLVPVYRVNWSFCGEARVFPDPSLLSQSTTHQNPEEAFGDFPVWEYDGDGYSSCAGGVQGDCP